MIASTRWLFLRLLSALEIDTVCDVGSMNGADALAFRATLPHAEIHAFEANPHNFSRMRDDRRLREARIGLLHAAVAECDGEGDLFLVKADYSLPHDRRGMSSLHKRVDGTALDGIARVRMLRLDSWRTARPDERVAVWIDVEGKAYEAIQGAAALLASVQLVHVEVETAPCIGPNQRMYSATKALLENFGFAQIATDRSPHEIQLNALFVRRDLASNLRRRVTCELWLAWMRRVVGVVLRSSLPAQAVRWLAKHL